MPSLNPYLPFKNEARQAMEFYQSVFGGDLMVSTFSEYPGMVEDPDEQNLVMHAQLETPDGFVLMGADTPSHMEYQEGLRISVSLSGDDEATLRGYWDGLVDGGSVTVPLEKAPWGDTFGMCADRFGVAWLVNIAGSPEG
jgi:PhnB protein